MPDIRKDNRGATLVVVMAIFVVLAVVASNVIMLVNASNATTNDELNATKLELCIMSIYDVLDDKIITGEFDQAFVDGEDVSIDILGFKDELGADIETSMMVSRVKNMATVNFYITLSGEEYCVTAKYTYVSNEGTVTIANKEVCGIEKVN